MTLLIVRDVPRNKFALILNNERVAEFATASAAWEFCEDQFGVAEHQPLAKSAPQC
jgi:hypothetical protein